MRNAFKLFTVFSALAAALLITEGCVRKPASPAGFIVTGKYLTPEEPMEMNDITASELVGKIYIGWNLGNTLDAAGERLGATMSAARLETAWGNPVTTKENFAALKDAGFNTIRIPVSWSKAVDGNYKVREDWMERVVEVVNYAFDLNMFVILNTHHDESIFGFTNDKMEESKKAFKTIWEQIAAVFKNYDERLIFEALNEPRTPGSAKEWAGGTPEEHANLNVYYQLFVDTVRASGGNNGKRALMVNTYAASAEPVAINALKIPNDTVENKIIVSVHAYAPYNFALNRNPEFNKWDKNNGADTSQITDAIDRVQTAFLRKNIPVIWGEFGAMNKDNTEDRVRWAEFYTGYAKSKGMPCVWWDNGIVTGESAERFGLLDRRTNEIIYPGIVEALMRGAGVPR